MSKLRYNLLFDDEDDDLSIEFFMYVQQREVRRNGGEERGCAFHMRRLIELAVPEIFLVRHSWLWEHVDIFCDGLKENRGFWTVWGPAAGGKTNDFGLCALLDWAASPRDTLTLLCSTTRDKLEKRIWEAVTRYHAILRGILPGVLSRQRMGIINAEDRDDGSIKAGIFGLAVESGKPEDAIGNIVGLHLPRVRLILDEGQFCREAAYKARINLSKGCRHFMFGAMGNPKSRIDQLGGHSRPVDGWRKVEESPEYETSFGRKWKTERGMCYWFDGLLSPAVVEPHGEEKYSFLINRRQIEDTAKTEGKDSIDYWQMCRGFVAPEALLNTVLNESFIMQFNLMGPPRWREILHVVAGVDPAFSSDGDDCELRIAKVGYLNDGTLAVGLHPPVNIPLVVSQERPLIYRIADAVIDQCKKAGVEKRNLGVDDSGYQSLADVIDEEWKEPGQRVHRVDFNAVASELPVSVHDPAPAHDKYDNRVTELWFSLRHYGQYGQIKNLDEETAQELCNRLVESGRKKRLESKREMKHRHEHSPDKADALVITLSVVREVLGIQPGMKKPGIMEAPSADPFSRSLTPEASRAYGLDRVDDEYLHDQFEADHAMLRR